jgi:hypothetical protein
MPIALAFAARSATRLGVPLDRLAKNTPSGIVDFRR